MSPVVLATISLLLALPLVSATCENQDYHLPVELRLEQAQPLEPAVIEVSLPYRGRNSLDYSITNTGDHPADFGLAVATCLTCSPSRDCGIEGLHCLEEVGFCAGDELHPCDQPVTEGPITLSPAESTVGRLGERWLGLGDHLHVEFLCLPQEGVEESTASCSGLLKFVILLRQVECRVNTDCSSDEDCSPLSGTCEPSPEIEAQGCQVTGGSPAPASWLVWALLLIAFIYIPFRRLGVSSSRFLVISTIMFLSTSSMTTPAQASLPPDFRRTQLFFHPSFQMTHFVGPLRDLSNWSFGYGLTEGAQFGFVGINMTIDTDYFLTTEQAGPPPFNRGLQISRIQLATRFLYPLQDFRLFAELAGARVGMISNSLVEHTGGDTHFLSLGGAIGVRLVQFSPFYIEFRSQWESLIELPDTSLFSLQFSIGIQSIL